MDEKDRQIARLQEKNDELYQLCFNHEKELRIEFAKAALTGLLANPKVSENAYMQYTVDLAYHYADLMVEELKNE